MDERRMKGLMGLCVRAGQAVFGEEGCRKSVSGGQCGVLLLDGGISENSSSARLAVSPATGVRMPYRSGLSESSASMRVASIRPLPVIRGT